jgi:phosphohistidine phosphatase
MALREVRLSLDAAADAWRHTTLDAGRRYDRSDKITSMNLYLMRHADTYDGEQMDASRRLTPQGIEDAGEMAYFLADQIGRVDIVISSPFVRTMQTAEIAAEALGSYVASTTALEPDGLPVQAWKEIVRLAQASGDVLIVGHGPALKELVAWLMMAHYQDGDGDAGIKFGYGAVAMMETTPAVDVGSYVGDTLAVLRWFVTQGIVERDKAAAAVAEAANQFLEAIEIEETTDIEESLRHARHAAALDPLKKKLAKVLVSRWSKQKTELLKQKDRLAGAPSVITHLLPQEADAALRKRLQAAVTAHVNASGVFSADPEDKDIAAYDGIVTAAMKAGAARMEADHAIVVAKDKGNKAIADHLRTKGFAKLGKDIDATSRDRMVTALTNTLEKGGTYQDAVAAIKDTMDGFKDSRAAAIARTELADAYNQSMLNSAKEVDGAQKQWEPDGTCCEEICQPNVDQGAIDVDDDFDSGDDAPPGHTNCDCSLSYVFPKEAA